MLKGIEICEVIGKYTVDFLLDVIVNVLIK